MSTSSSEIKHHLDQAAAGGYLDAINGTTPESLVDAEMKIAPLWRALDPNESGPVLSIGVGQGEELHALRLGGGESRLVIGLDLSGRALERSVERSERYALGLGLIAADARQIPFGEGTLAGVVMSAVIHEIYSYCKPNGYMQFRKSIAEVSEAIAEEGVLYVREFACPPHRADLAIKPISNDADEFYDYFKDSFQVGLDDSFTSTTESSVRTAGYVSSGDLTQVLMHFKSFWNDSNKGYTFIGDSNWKEIKESYVIRDPFDRSRYLDPDLLCEDIVSAGSTSTHGLELISKQIRLRKKANIFLAQHFKIYDSEGNDVSEVLIPQSTAKLEAIFRKVKLTGQDS